MSAVVPAGYENYLIPGATVKGFAASGKVVFVQEVEIGASTLYDIKLSTQEPARFELDTGRELSMVLISLQGNWQLNSPQFGQKEIREGHFNLLVTRGLQVTGVFRMKKKYELVLLTYAKNNLSEKFLLFPSLEETAAFVFKKISWLLFEQSPPAGALIMEHVLQLVHSSFYPVSQNFHDHYINQLLLNVLDLAAKNLAPSLRYSSEEINALYGAKLWIDAHIDRHYTIEEIAREVGLNRRKLGTGFKDLFGMGLYAYLLEERLQGAKKQLAASRKPIKEIAKNAGYHSTSNFSIAFKKKFGETPGAFRKK